MLAGRTFLGCFSTFVDVATIGAVPLHYNFLFKDFASGYIGGQLPITSLVELFYLGDFLE